MGDSNYTLRCERCGKFLSHKLPYYTYTYYANSTMVEPPEPVFAHPSCYETLDSQNKALLDKICWRSPFLVEPDIFLETPYIIPTVPWTEDPEMRSLAEEQDIAYRIWYGTPVTLEPEQNLKVQYLLNSGSSSPVTISFAVSPKTEV